MHLVSKNFVETLVCKGEYDLKLWSHKQRISNNKTTIRHCSIPECRWGHPIKQSPRALPELCTQNDLWSI